MRLHFIGSGDAFGSGGRFNTCFHITGEKVNFLIDCGASSLISLKAKSIDLNSITTILCTHFHADHFGGIPFFMLDAQFFSKRTQPLTIAGPPGLTKHFKLSMETNFPGSSKTKPRFELFLIELEKNKKTMVGELKVTPFEVNHGNPGGPYFAYRIRAEDRIISYSGDTEWTDNIIEAGYKADLLIAEAYFYKKKVKLHLDYNTLTKHLPLIKPKRLILTHMSDDMLSRLPSIPHEVAEDGKLIEL